MQSVCGQRKAISKILDKLEINSNIVIDYQIPELFFGRKFKVRIPERTVWCDESVLFGYDIVIFTDGAKNETGCGAGFHISDTLINLGYKLPDTCTIFQCEIIAIQYACEFAGSVYNGKNIAICSDSQAALQSLNSGNVKAKTVGKCIFELNRAASKNSIDLIWVPGHSNIEGNVIADMLAAQGASLHRSYTEKVPIPMCHIKSMIKDNLNIKWKKAWENTSSGLNAKTLFPAICNKSSAFILSHNRDSIRKIIQVLTGHWPIGKHGIRMGIPVARTCPGCELPSEELTAKHFWCSYYSLSTLRKNILNAYF